MQIKIYPLITTLILAVSALSCNKAEIPVSEPEEITVSYNVTLDEQTKAIGDGQTANFVWYAIYKVIETEGTVSYVLSTPPAMVPISASAPAECPVTMVRDQAYKVVFVSQYYSKETQPYVPSYWITSETATLHMPDEPIANSDRYDLFSYVDTIEKYSGSTNKSVQLSRMVAQVNFVTDPSDLAAAEIAGKTPEQSAVILAGVPQSVSLLDGTVSDNTKTVQYQKAQIAGIDQNHLATVFCLASPEGNDVNASLYIYKGTDTLLKEYAQITRIPCRANYRTNVKVSYTFE